MMPVSNLFLIAAAAAVCMLCQQVAAYKLEDMTDGRCAGPGARPFPQLAPTTFDIDQEWVKSVGTWYYTYGSKMDLFQSAARGHFIKFEDVKATDAFYKICNLYIWDGMHQATVYINGKLYPFTQHMNLTDGVLYWDMGLVGVGGGKSTMPYSDNKSIIIFVTCWQDGSLSWAIMSTTPTLTDEQIKTGKDWARAHGFHEKYDSLLRYESCVPTVESVLETALADHAKLTSSANDGEKDEL